MAITLSINGTNFSFPSKGDEDWAADVNAVVSALASTTLQKSGGSFTLTAEADFGATYGLKSAYFKSRTSNPASAGTVRLANTDTLTWRNAANDANITLTVNASDQLTFRGVPIAGDNTLTESRAVATDANGVLATIATTSTELGYVSGVTSSIQTQLNAKQASDSTLTALAAYNTNGLLTQTAADTFTGRTLTAGSNKLSVTNGNGVSGNPTVDVTEANLTLDNLGGTLAISKGGTGQTTATAAFDALSPTTTKGDLAAHDGTNNVRVGVGSNGQVLTADSAQDSGLTWTSPLTNPMTTAGDLIVGGADGAATRLAIGTAGQILRSDGTDIAWTDGLATADQAGLVSRETSGSFDATFIQSSGSYSQTVSVRYSKVGRQVTIEVPNFEATSGAASTISASAAVPEGLRPEFNQTILVSVRDAGTVQANPGMLFVNTTGTITLWKGIDTANFSSSGNAGLRQIFTLTYRVAES